MPAPHLETDRLLLRPHRIEDFAPMAAFLASDAARFIGGPYPERHAWHAFGADVGAWDLTGFGCWGIEEKATGAFAGQVGLMKPPFFPEREIGWLLFAGFEGRGLATEAARAARGFAYGPLGWTTAVSYVHPANTRSAAVARRLGCTEDPSAQPLDPEDLGLPPPVPGSAAMTMSDAIRRAADLLRDHRKSIDRLDAILLFTLAERFKHTQAVGVLKAQHGLPPSDPARESVQIARLERLAEEADLDPEFARKFLHFIISEVIRHHEIHLENGPMPNTTGD